MMKLSPQPPPPPRQRQREVPRRRRSLNRPRQRPLRFTFLKVALFIGGCLSTSTISIIIYLYAREQLLQGTHARAGGTHSQRTTRLRHSSSAADSALRTRSHRMSHPNINNNNDRKKSPDNNNNWLDPTLSTPPAALDLSRQRDLPVLPDWQRRRYACVRSIRRRQEEILRDEWDGNLLRNADVVLVDPAYHANVGDHMITVAEQRFWVSQQRQQQRPHQGHVRECGYFQAGPWAPPCDRVLTEEPQQSSSQQQHQQQPQHHQQQHNSGRRRLAVWHGGGNWGDLWDTIHATRTSSMTTLLRRNYTVLGMPQSLYFQNPVTAQRNAREFRQAVTAGLSGDDNDVVSSSSWDDAQLESALHGRLTLTWRERESAVRARHLYPYAKHVILPDIAFQLGPYDAKTIVASQSSQQQQPPQVDVLFFLRDDVESVYAHVRDRRSIRQLLMRVSRETHHARTARFTYSIVDWPDRLDRFASTDYYFTDTAIQLLHAGKVLICDRLHAAILAYLAGVPFVFVDQVSGKITKTFAVAMRGDDCQSSSSSSSSLALWERADNLTHAIAEAAVLWERVAAVA